MDIIEKIKDFLKEEQIEDTPGVVKNKTLKALNYMKNNLEREEVKLTLERLNCKGCKEKSPSTIVDSLIEMVNNTPSEHFYLIKELWRIIKHFNFK